VGPRLARLVGLEPAVPRARVRAHALPARPDRDGGRHHLPLRHRRHPRRLDRAREAAGDLNIHIAGGPTTTNAYLAAGLVDELALQISPVVLGEGIRLLDGVGRLDLEPIAIRPTSLVTHARYRVRYPDGA